MRKIDMKKNKYIFNIKKSLIIFVLAIISVKIGIMGGNLIFNSNMQVVEIVDIEVYRMALKNSLPLIDTIYNSGNISYSFSGQLHGFMKKIFHFDLAYPITVINAQSPLFYNYYSNSYSINLNNRGIKEPYFYIADLDTIESTDLDTKLINMESSITYNPEEEDNYRFHSHDGEISLNEIIINNNETNYRVNIEELMKEPLKISSDKKGPQVLIYHTHTTESFIKDLSQLGQSGIPNRTTDARNNVVRVGEELAQILRKKYSIEVIHNATIHNYPSDTGAYGRSLNTASNILKSYPSIQIVLDIHRDGIHNDKLRVVNEINGKQAAKIMFVVGTDDSGLIHPEWRENLKFAIKLQDKLNKRYPGITRPIYLSRHRYNQHLSNGSILVEIGGDGNLLSECLESTKYLAEVINELLNQ
ncbi:UNVERIFIED_CONTAM: stage II sporulation protein P [Acetivibrio alkalicellulosi]